MSRDPPPDDQDLDNPYAPPRSAFLPEAAPQQFGGIPFTVGDVFNWSWALFKQRPWPSISIFWGAVGMNWALAFGIERLQTGLMTAVRDPSFFFFLVVIMRVVGIVVQVWIGIGMNVGLLKIARHEPVSFDVLFTGGRFLVTMILASIVVGAIVFVPVVTLAVALTSLLLIMQRMESLIALLLVVACGGLGAALILYLLARLMQFYYLVIDQNVGVLESIKWSWQLTKGRASTIILVYLLQVCVVLGGLLACCVGAIIALPVSGMMIVVTYLALAEPAKTADKTPPIVWVEEL